MIFDGRARERDPPCALEPFDGSGLRGRGVLDGLRLVKHDELPSGLLQPVQPPHQAVGGDDQIKCRQLAARVGRDARQHLGVAFRTVGIEHVQRGSESLDLLLPVGADQKRGQNADQK